MWGCVRNHKIFCRPSKDRTELMRVGIHSTPLRRLNGVKTKRIKKNNKNEKRR